MINLQPPYPICPACGGKLAGFARPNKPFKNDPYDYDQKTAELYCTNPEKNCIYRVKFSELTTPINKPNSAFNKCKSSPHCSHNTNGRDLDKPCSIQA